MDTSEAVWYHLDLSPQNISRPLTQCKLALPTISQTLIHSLLPITLPNHTNLEVALVDDGRAGDGVLAEAAGIDVDKDTGVRGAVRTGELDTRRELATVATSDLDLLIVENMVNMAQPSILLREQLT